MGIMPAGVLPDSESGAVYAMSMWYCRMPVYAGRMQGGNAVYLVRVKLHIVVESVCG